MSKLGIIGASLVVGTLVTGCGAPKSDAKATGTRNLKVKMGDKAVAPTEPVTAQVSTFDPNADQVFDLDAWGNTWPDSYEVQQAFFSQFSALDACVVEEKARRKTSSQLAGDVHMAVKLNPKESRPFGVNADLPSKYAKSAKLTDCMREAAASAPYPKYDGPPIVVDFDFELDAGSDYVEE